MRRIIISSIAIVFVATGLVVGGTGAFFSDEESSTGNTFSAGAIDLKIDNHSWYNGIECTLEGIWEDPEGNAEGDPYLESLIGEPCASSWELSDLDGHLFFDLQDLKPGDWEEDTISFHVENNDAWLCATLATTKDDDVSSNEPELEAGDVEEDELDNWDGELGSELHFIFWADDGDNVLEDDEEVVLSGTPAELDGWGVDDNEGQTFPLVDSTFNVWNEEGGPLPASNEPVYIGKAFCYGEIVLDPVAQGDNSPAVDPGFDCSGAETTNMTQTDSLMGDLSFFAIQSRNNEDFTCTDEGPRAGTITFEKIVEGGDALPGDFTFQVDGAGSYQDGDTFEFLAGEHTVTELPEAGYTPDFSACGESGVVTVIAGEDVLCTVTNTEDTGTVTFTKIVEGGSAVPADFTFQINGAGAHKSGDVVELAPGDYTVTEFPFVDYTPDFSACGTDGVITIVADGNVDCTVTNTLQQGTITVVKVVENLDSELSAGATADQWTLLVDATEVTNNVAAGFDPGTYQIGETGGPDGYTATFEGDCDANGEISLLAGQDLTCTITNTEDTGTITFAKLVQSGPADPGTFPFQIDGIGDFFDLQVVEVPAGEHVITETINPSYSVSFQLCGVDNGDSGTVTVPVDGNVNCNVINQLIIN